LSTDEICFAEPGVDCFCGACLSRTNLASTAPPRFDFGSDSYHASENIENNFPQTTLGGSQQFLPRNPNSFGCANSVQDALSTLPTQNLAHSYLRPVGGSNRAHSGSSPLNTNTPSTYQDQETFSRGQLGENLFGHPHLSSYSTNSWNPNSSRSVGPPNQYQEYQQFPNSGVNHPLSGSLQSIPYGEMIPQSHQGVPRQRNNRKSLKPNISHSQASRKHSQTAWPECKQFLKAQEHLDFVLKIDPSLSNAQKEGLSKLLEVSTSQLESFIQARNTVKPILNNLAAASLNLGLPPDHVAAWFLQIPHSKLSNTMTDSAYESNLSASPEQVRAAKRQKRSSGTEIHPKPFQCTYINASKSYCLQASKDYNDWKRHEETHYPQKRWVCPIRELSQDISCHICSEKISCNAATRNHDACLQEECGPGHFFFRKDKLLAHIKADHGFSGPTSTIESWYQSLSPDWKRQCGFCGEQFSEWDKRCRHVEQHFHKGKRMKPDWKDPWPEGTENSDHNPDDDEDKGGNDMGDGHAGQGDEPGKDDAPPKGQLWWEQPGR